MHIGVYCASSDGVEAVYFETAERMGRLLAEGGHTLVYGGGNVGLMGALARSTHAHGGAVFGVIPEALKAREGVAYEVADELVVTETMSERKAIMYTRADAFIALPGGFGTLEEFMEVLTLRQLRYHRKPIALVNTRGFYDPLVDLFEHFYARGFAHARYRALYHLAADPEAALHHVTTHRPAPVEEKWT